MLKIFLFAFLIILMMGENSAQATSSDLSCAPIDRETFDAIDAAMPCINFEDPSTYSVAGTPITRGGPLLLRPLLQKGVYQQVMRDNQTETECRRDKYRALKASPENTQQMLDAVKAGFLHYLPALRSLINDNVTDIQQSSMYVDDGGMAPPGLADRLTARDNEMRQLASRVPFGFEPRISGKLYELARRFQPGFQNDPAQVAQFEQEIRSALDQTIQGYDQATTMIRGLWRAQTCVYRSSGPSNCGRGDIRNQGANSAAYNCVHQYAMNNAPRACPAGQAEAGGFYVHSEDTSDSQTLADITSLEKAFSAAGSYTTVAQEVRARLGTHPLASQISHTLQCNADHYADEREGQEAISFIAAGAAAGPGGAAVALIYLPFAAQSIINSCFRQTTGFLVANGRSCSENGNLVGDAIHAADSSDCGKNIIDGTLNVAVPLAGEVVDGVRTARAAGAEARVAGAEADALGAEARVAGTEVRAADDEVRVLSDAESAAANDEIVVTGHRPPQGRPRVSGAGEVGGVRAAATDTRVASTTSDVEAAALATTRELSAADRQALADLNLESLNGVDRSHLAGSVSVTEVEETRAAVNTSLSKMSTQNRHDILSFLKDVDTSGAGRRDNYFAILINTKNDEIPSVLARLRRAQASDAGRESVLRELEGLISAKTNEYDRALIRAGNNPEDPHVLKLAEERSALEFQSQLIDLRDEVRVRGVFSSDVHNANFSGKGHSLSGKFNVDIEVMRPENVSLCRGSYASTAEEFGSSALTGGFFTFCRTHGYNGRRLGSQISAAPSAVLLPEAEQGYSRFSSFNTREGQRFSIGQNGPVTYGNGSGGAGGGVESFFNRYPRAQQPTIDELRASVRTPNCDPVQSIVCNEIFSLQESVRVDSVAARGTQREQLTYLQRQSAAAESVLRDMEPQMREYERLLQQRNYSAGELARFRSENPELVSALNLRHEIELKQASVRAGDVRRVDSETQELLNADQSIGDTVSRAESALNPQTATTDSIARAYSSEIMSSPVYVAYTNRLDRIQELSGQLRNSTNLSAAERNRIAQEIHTETARSNDMLLALRGMESSMARSIRGRGYSALADENAQKAVTQDAFERVMNNIRLHQAGHAH